MSFLLRPRARRDISDILAYIAVRNPQAARAWRDAIFRIFDLLAINPHLGAAHDEVRIGLRMFPTGNYIVLYHTNGDGVLIVRIIHAARDWRTVSR